MRDVSILILHLSSVHATGRGLRRICRRVDLWFPLDRLAKVTGQLKHSKPSCSIEHSKAFPAARKMLF